MSQEKAYKLLAVQEGISNNEAKNLIDNGQVFAYDKKILIARGLISSKTTFKVIKAKEAKIIYQDDDILAVNKPVFMTSEEISKKFKFSLLNRLDKETSGVLLLVKNEEFQKKAIEEFKHLRVKKTYVAMVKGIVSEEIVIDNPILTIKTKGGAFSKISPHGKAAVTKVEPLMVSGKRSIIKVIIETGRTHQIRVHLASINHPIIGDEKYSKESSKRLFLHSYETEILGYKFRANLDSSFHVFGFEILKDI